MEYMKKTCFKCGIEKELDCFYKHPAMPDGRVNKCKDCNKADVRANYSKNKKRYRKYDKTRQRHSRTRIFNHRYNQIKQRVEGRATRRYSVEGKELLSYLDYCAWIKNNIDSFEKVYKRWEDSGYKRGLTPSIDRVDNKKGYIGSNMRWITVSENSTKYNKVIPF